MPFHLTFFVFCLPPFTLFPFFFACHNSLSASPTKKYIEWVFFITNFKLFFFHFFLLSVHLDTKRQLAVKIFSFNQFFEAYHLSLAAAAVVMKHTAHTICIYMICIAHSYLLLLSTILSIIDLSVIHTLTPFNVPSYNSYHAQWIVGWLGDLWNKAKVTRLQ